LAVVVEVEVAGIRTAVGTAVDMAVGMAVGMVVDTVVDTVVDKVVGMGVGMVVGMVVDKKAVGIFELALVADKALEIGVVGLGVVVEALAAV
jgi:large-conductance mechanosensitive channel